LPLFDHAQNLDETRCLAVDVAMGVRWRELFLLEWK